MLGHVETASSAARKLKQPKGGYLSTKLFSKEQLSDNKELSDNENISAATIGMAVDYLFRYLSGKQTKDELLMAFDISLKGVLALANTYYDYTPITQAKRLLNYIYHHDPLSDKSIIAACKLTGFDVCYRSAPAHYVDIDSIVPNKDTLNNIRIMVERCLSFIQQYGPTTQMGIDFTGAFTLNLVNADGDFLTAGTLWDLKTSKKTITTRDTFQILIYYVLGMHSDNEKLHNIDQLGFYNPRLNMVRRIDASQISSNIIYAIEKDVIGYDENAFIAPLL